MSREDARWSVARANDWYNAQPWIAGCNFTPSTAINQLEMWQTDAFDAATIDRELGWAAALGINSARVFLHDLLWTDSASFIARLDAFLAIAQRHGIRPMFVLFDDCWHDGARLGPQPAPKPGVHNSGWLQSPGDAALDDVRAWDRLEAYVKGVMGAFASDHRVLAWDIYNEVTNQFLVDSDLRGQARREAMAAATERRLERMPLHLRLFDLSFDWARSCAPEQPLTAGAWLPDRDLNERIIAASDVISFHSYGSADELQTRIERLRRHGRPLICTEFMARPLGSRFETHLPIFKAERVGWYCWGLVNGKTQTHIAWTGGDDPWFHDILRADGTPYDERETSFIRSTTGARELSA